MNNKYLALLPLVGLSVAFIVITILIIITKGSNHSLIKKKLKVGAAIIILTSFFACETNNTKKVPVHTCYMTVYTRSLNIDNIVDGNIVVEYSPSIIITGAIQLYSGPDISYSIFNQKDSTIDSGYIIPKDGTFDIDNLDVDFFKIEFFDIQPGSYNLNFYEGSINEQIPENIICDAILTIK